MIKYPYDSPRGPHHTFARNVKYSGGLQNFTEVPIRPNPISLAHCKMLPAIPIQDIGSKGFSPNRSIVNVYKCCLEYKKKSLDYKQPSSDLKSHRYLIFPYSY